MGCQEKILNSQSVLPWEGVHLVFGVLARVGSLVLEPLEQAVHKRREERGENGTNPVDPVVTRERLHHDVGTKRSGGVQTGTGVKHGKQVTNEQGKTNDHGARYVILDFSTAVNKTAKCKMVVANISMKRPREIEHSPPKALLKRTGPGVKALAVAAAAIPAMT